MAWLLQLLRNGTW